MPVVLALFMAAQAGAGVWLHADAGAGVVGGDPVAATSLGFGIEHDAFALHLRAPLALRLVDLPPAVSSTLPPACRVVRCEEWLENGTLSPAALSRLVDEARLLRAGDTFHLRAGRLFATIGHGILVDSYTNVADWDKRKSGAYAELNLRPGRAQVQGLVGNVFAPQELFALRAALHPLIAPDDAGAIERWLERATLSVEVAGDAVAPSGAAIDGGGDVIPGAASRPLVGAALALAWPLLEPGALALEPFAAVATLHGLPVAANGVPASVIGGVVVGLDAAVLALRVGARGFVDGGGQRHAIFATLYDVDRRKALRADGTFAPGGLVDEPADGGVGGDADLELLLLRAARAGVRVRRDSTAQGSFAEAWAGIELDWLRAAARVRQRGLARAEDVVAFGDRTLVVLETSMLVMQPFALEARWLHGPRFTNGLPIAYDDVFVGISLSVVLEPA